MAWQDFGILAIRKTGSKGRLMRIPAVHLAQALGIAMFVLPASARADEACYDKAQTQAQLTECSAKDLKQADDRLNRLYKEMQARLKGDEETLKLLVDAQRKWLVFRDAECTLQTVRTAGGSINAMNFNGCLAGLTQARARDLQNHLDCGRQSGEQEAAGCAIPRAN